MSERYSVYGKIVNRGKFFVWDRERSSIVHPVTGDCLTTTPWALSTVEEAEAAAARLNAALALCASYNRIVATCFNAAGQDVGKLQLDGGFAVEWCSYSRGFYGTCPR